MYVLTLLIGSMPSLVFNGFLVLAPLLLTYPAIHILIIRRSQEKSSNLGQKFFETEAEALE